MGAGVEQVLLSNLESSSYIWLARFLWLAQIGLRFPRNTIQCYMQILIRAHKRTISLSHEITH